MLIAAPPLLNIVFENAWFEFPADFRLSTLAYNGSPCGWPGREVP